MHSGVEKRVRFASVKEGRIEAEVLKINKEKDTFVARAEQLLLEV